MFASPRGLPFLPAMLILSFSVAAAQPRGGMLPPAIDPDTPPFSYFWHPTDVIGAFGAPAASEVTPEGYVYNGFGDLMFFTGNPPTPVNQRIKTLHNGYLPVVQYQLQDNEVDYQFTVFASDLGGPLAGVPVNFVRVVLTNHTNGPRAAFLSSAFRVGLPISRPGRGPDYRFRQRFDLIPERLVQGQKDPSPDWEYSFSPDNCFLRNGRILYTFPASPEPQQALLTQSAAGLPVFRFYSGEVQENATSKMVLDPSVPVGLVMYRVPLQPNQSTELVFKLPLAPVPKDRPEARLVQESDFAQELNKTERFWEDLVVKRATLRFPETKIQEYLIANTIFNLLAIDRIGEDFVINVNKFQYHRLYPGNGSNMVVALDYLGLKDIARDCLYLFRKAQQPDGRMVNVTYNATNPIADVKWQSFEITGYVLWSWGRHYQLIRDEEFLRRIYPGVQAGVQWMKDKASQDPLGLMPPATVADDAMLANVRQTGQSIWALIALKGATRMAEAMKDTADVTAFKAEYDRYRTAFENHLAKQLEKSGGSIPPALERTLDGNRWDELLLLYPDPLFEPYDPRITATLADSRKRYAEGILGFGWQTALAKKGEWPPTTLAGIKTVEDESYVYDDTLMLHYWQTPNNAENALVRGGAEDQEWAVRDLYALLVHTTSTHAPQEFNTTPWSIRDFGNNLTPDGAASAKTIELLRNMVLREYNQDLVLFSALSPDWFRAGKKLEAIQAPSNFGPLDLTLSVLPDGESWRVDLPKTYRNAPARLLLRIPWFYELKQAQVDGRKVEPVNGHLVLDPSAKQVEVSGRIRPGSNSMSYDQAVRDYKEEYRKRYEEFQRTGTIRP